MKNLVLDRIKAFAIKELTKAYGYCGVAESDDIAMLNCSDDKSNNIQIEITCEPEESEFEQQTEGGYTDDDGGNLPNG